MHSKYDPKLAERLVDLGRRGYLIKSAAEALGISHPTFRRYEREHAEFAKAAKGVRRNSEKHERLRVAKWLKKTERELLWALAKVRKKRQDNIQKIIWMRNGSGKEIAIVIDIQERSRAPGQ